MWIKAPLTLIQYLWEVPGFHSGFKPSQMLSPPNHCMEECLYPTCIGLQHQYEVARNTQFTVVPAKSSLVLDIHVHAEKTEAKGRA